LEKVQAPVPCQSWKKSNSSTSKELKMSRPARKPSDGRRKSRAQRREWWASLTAGQQGDYIDAAQLRKASRPNAAALEASARLDLAAERGVFMVDIPDAAVAARLLEMKGTQS
jgi:hypothetical protein